MNIEYIAGLFDGEGSVRITFEKRRNKPYVFKMKNPTRGNFQMGASVANTHLYVLRKLKEKFGGRLSADSKRKDKPHWKNCFTWSIASKSAENFLRAIEPFVIIKKNHIKIALKFQEGMGEFRATGQKRLSEEEFNRRKKFKEELNLINARGNNYKYYTRAELNLLVKR